MANETVKVCSVLPVLGHPRDSKRVSMLQAAGFQVEAAAFERDYHTGRMPSCPVTSLGRISHGRYLARAFKMLRALPTLRRVLRRNQVAYASGPDMALFAILAGFGLGVRVIVEVGDIRHAQVARGWKGRLSRGIDRFIVNHSKLLVVTARGFAEDYYQGRLKSRTPVLLMENKLDEEPLKMALAGRNPNPPEAFDPSRRPLRIGYFGVLRCAWSWNLLMHVAKSMPDRVRVIAAGYCMHPVEAPDPGALPANFEFRGKYKSPEDLPALYGSVDIVWACYPEPGVIDPDWRWAQSVCRSNRFYESCFFKRPLISMLESGDGREVERLGVGLLLREQGDEAVLKAIAGITGEDIARWGRALAGLPRSVGVYTEEAGMLANAIRAMCR
ncbi:MAG: glycosyltransferase [Planctomycetes bacterium]|nr:glycosyltransferase [Planctomycetota bacterium]